MRIVGEGSISFEDKEREYDVVDRKLGGAPKYFILYNGGRPYISDEVPEHFRKHMVFHELFENEIKQGKYKEGRSVRALMEEIDLVPEEEREEYIPFRIEVYRSLVDFLEEHEPTSPFLPEARRSSDFLKRIAEELWL